MTVTSQTSLAGDVDAEERFARFPPGFTLKGMFFSRMMDIGGRHAKAALDALSAPPRLGRYLPFSDYPQVDYSRLAHAVSVGLFPDAPVPEAMRRLARLDHATFASSTVGKVSLALASDAGRALLMLPKAFGAVMRGGEVRAAQVEREVFRIDFREFYGWVDCYPIGTVEGMVQRFDRRCAIDLDMRSPVDATYTVRLV